jgi:twitching motility protein PilT
VALLDSILTLLAQMKGDAVLLHADKAPVMLTPNGQSPMPFSPLQPDQMRAIVTGLVPTAMEPQLEQEGSVQFVMPAQGNRPALAVTAIGRGEDSWLELRLAAAQDVPALEPPAAEPRSQPEPAPEPRPARAPVVGDAPKRLATIDDVNALIARAAARGDSTLLLQSDSVPALKVDGAIEWLDGFEPIAAGDLQRVSAELAAAHVPAAADSVLRWKIEHAAAVECRLTKSESRTEVAMMITSAQPAAAERLGIPAAVSDTCRDDFGLVLVAGSEARRVSRTCHSLIDLVNRERAHHIIALESESVTCHPRRSGYVSQRVVSGDDGAWLRAIERAISEEPDVLMIDHVPSWRALEALLAYAAEALVIVQSGAGSALDAVEGLVVDVPSSSRSNALERVAASLAAVVGQREIKCRGGGAAVSAFEVIVGTPAARAFVAEGAFDNLALTLERGVDGMISMATAVVGLLRAGRITARQACIAVPGLAIESPVHRGDRPVAIRSGAEPLVPIGEPVDLSEMLASIAEAEG